MATHLNVTWQLACLNGGACSTHGHTIDTIQCTNVGEDDRGEVQWRCVVLSALPPPPNSTRTLSLFSHAIDRVSRIYSLSLFSMQPLSPLGAFPFELSGTVRTLDDLCVPASVFVSVSVSASVCMRACVRMSAYLCILVHTLTRTHTHMYSCDADLDAEIKLGDINVSCEGYSSSSDPKKLRGRFSFSSNTLVMGVT